jgi:peptidoglycan/LPS O-acetylase OafA/YrhL
MTSTHPGHTQPIPRFARYERIVTTALSPADAPTRPLAADRHRSPVPFVPGKRYHEVDVLRFLAAAAVVGFHFLFRSTTGSPQLAATGFSDPGGVFRYGYLGVDLFFVISGFVILRSAWNKTPSRYLASRAGRLYPTFWVACTITALVVAVVPFDAFDASFRQWLGNLPMASESYGVHYVDGVYWTLAVELAFYVLVLGLVRLRLTVGKVVVFGCSWLAVSALDALWPRLLDVGAWPGPYQMAPRLLGLLLVPDWAPYFVAGMMFALVAKEGWRLRYTLPLVAAYGCSLWRAVLYAESLTGKYQVYFSPVVVAAVVTAIFLLFVAIVSGVTVPGARRLAVLGGLTYPLYLVHENIGFAAFDAFHGQLGWNRWLVLGIVVALVGGLAWVLHVAVEERFARPLAAFLERRWMTVQRLAASAVMPL